MSYVDINEEYRSSMYYVDNMKEFAKESGYHYCSSCGEWYDSQKDFNGNYCFMCDANERHLEHKHDASKDCMRGGL